MRGPVPLCVTVIIIIEALSRPKCWYIHKQRKDGRGLLTSAHISNPSEDLTVYTSELPAHQTSHSWVTPQPVVYVALDEDLSAKLFPQRDVDGVVVCFVQWRSCRDWHIHFSFYWPIWSWCDCVWCIFKLIVICESIAPHLSPVSSICLHVAVSLECVVPRITA